LPLLVFATGMWIDFVEGVVGSPDYADMGRAYALSGANDAGSRAPFELLHGTIAAFAAMPLVAGWWKLFALPSHAPRPVHETPHVEPYLHASTIGVRGTF
jgi:hypothetical protein